MCVGARADPRVSPGLRMRSSCDDGALVEGNAVQFVDVEVNHAGVHLDAELRCAAFVGRLGAAVAESDGPVVQRAGHAFTEHDALAQWSALVRAAVEQREDLVLGVAKDGDVAALFTRHAACTEHGDVVDTTDRFPVAHAVAPATAPATAPTGTNCLTSTLALSNSNHGSGSP